MKKLLLLIVITLASMSANAQTEQKTMLKFDIAVDMDSLVVVTAPTNVRIGERFRVSFTYKTISDVKNFQAPDLKGFEIIAGPSTSSSFSAIGGITKGTKTFTFSLVAQTAGTYTIGSAYALVDGQEVKSKKVDIVVGSQTDTANTQATEEEPTEKDQASPTTISEEDLYVTANVSKKSVGVNEHVVLTYKLYTHVQVESMKGDKIPHIEGLKIKEEVQNTRKEIKYEDVMGRKYGTVVWDEYVVVPKRRGTFTIPHRDFEVEMVQQEPSIDPLEAFFNEKSSLIRVKRRIVAPSVTIYVK